MLAGAALDAGVHALLSLACTACLTLRPVIVHAPGRLCMLNEMLGWLRFRTRGVGLIALLLLSWMPGALFAADLVPFVLPWDDGSASAVSMNALSDAPAGKAGPLSVDAQ